MLVVLGGGTGAGGVTCWAAGCTGNSGTVFSWGMFAVNVLGSLMIGLVFGLAQAKPISPGTTLLLAAGVLGGFTTFSYETMRLLAGGSIGAPFPNVAGQFAVGLADVYLGFETVRGLVGV